MQRYIKPLRVTFSLSSEVSVHLLSPLLNLIPFFWPASPLHPSFPSSFPCTLPPSQHFLETAVPQQTSVSLSWSKQRGSVEGWLRCARTAHGSVYVVTHGPNKAKRWHAGNWNTTTMVCARSIGAIYVV